MHRKVHGDLISALHAMCSEGVHSAFPKDLADCLSNGAVNRSWELGKLVERVMLENTRGEAIDTGKEASGC